MNDERRLTDAVFHEGQRCIRIVRQELRPREDRAAIERIVARIINRKDRAGGRERSGQPKGDEKP